MDIKAIGSITFQSKAKISEIPKMRNISSKFDYPSSAKLEGYTAFVGADVYTPQNKLAKQDLLFRNGKLIAINEFDTDLVGEEGITVVNAKDKYIAPGILDEHIHGGYRVNFHTSSEEKIRELLRTLAKEGTPAILATTLPGQAEHVRKRIETLSRIIQNPQPGEARILGIHLEGPFLNPDKRGIHNPEKILPLSIDTYKSLDPKDISMITLAPELDEGYKLTEYLQKEGVIVSAGHSLASAKQLKESGIKQVTHLFNAMKPFHHREESIVNEGLMNDEITAELNSDTALMTHRTMDLIMKIKPEDKISLISDAIPNAGIKKDFTMNCIKIHVDDNWVAKDKDGVIAGSMRFIPDVAKRLIDNTIMTFEKFIRYASVNPAKNLGVSDKFELKEGNTPIFSIWDKKTLKHEKTFIA